MSPALAGGFLTTAPPGKSKYYNKILKKKRKENDYSNSCEVISHCGFDCISLVISGVEHIFMYLLAICIVFFVEVSIHVFSPF